MNVDILPYCLYCHRQLDEYAIYDSSGFTRPSSHGNAGYGSSHSGADGTPHQSLTSVVESHRTLSNPYVDNVSGQTIRSLEPPTFSDDSDRLDIPTSSLGRRQNEHLLQSAARPLPRRRERQDSERKQVASGEARKKDHALLEFIEQQSLFSITFAHRLTETQEADRRSSELFCNTESLAL